MTRRVLHASFDLAARIERIAADDMRRFAVSAQRLYPDRGADWIDVGNGCAMYVWPESPLNVACGLGFDDPFDDGAITAVERFYAERDGRVHVAVCPLADPSLVSVLAARGYVPHTFENVLAVDLTDGPPDEPGVYATVDQRVSVHHVGLDERSMWRDLVTAGFADGREPTGRERDIGELVLDRADATFLYATVDGHPAGTGELVVRDGIAWLSADTTLPDYRGMGVQTALQRARLELGAQAGCDLAVTEADPRGGSQRNMERRGFRVLYTRAEMVKRVGTVGRDGRDGEQR